MHGKNETLRGWVLFALMLAIAAVLMFIAPPFAFAAADNDYGKNLGDWLLRNLKSIWWAVVTLGALSIIFPGARKPALVFGFMGIMVLTGMVVFAHGPIEAIIKGMADAVANGT